VSSFIPTRVKGRPSSFDKAKTESDSKSDNESDNESEDESEDKSKDESLTDDDNYCILMKVQFTLIERLSKMFYTKLETLFDNVKQEIKCDKIAENFNKDFGIFFDKVKKKMKERLKTRFHVTYRLLVDEDQIFTNEENDKVVEEFDDQFQKLLSLYEIEFKSNIENIDQFFEKFRKDYDEMQKKYFRSPSHYQT